MTLQTWIIEPRDSLIVRDGKPFSAGVTHATSLDFPFPSTTTGGVRTRSGLVDGVFDVSQIDSIKEIEVRGALLAELDDEGEICVFYLPSPADSLLLQDDEQKRNKAARLYPLLPLNIEKLSGNANKAQLSNLPEQVVFPVGLNRTKIKGKPYGDLKFWCWEVLENWLTPRIGSKPFIDITNLENYGISSLQKDSRTHVAINENLTSEDGALFQTRGLEFNHGKGDLSKAKKLSLVVFLDETNSKKLEDKGNLAPLGGERRLVSWRKSNHTKMPLVCPPEIVNGIGGYCRLLLLTPAFFEGGFLPKPNGDFEVKAIACNRYQTVSGWDFVLNEPKPSRRLVPAGSVFFLKLNGDDVQRRAWINKTWFSCISEVDSESGQDFAKDGFGLCVLGTWDGIALENWE